MTNARRATADETRAIARRFNDVLARGDAEAAADLYDDALIVWHNYDRIERDKAHSVNVVRTLAADYDGFMVTDARLDLLPDGYAERCVFTGRHRASGQQIAVQAMLRVWTDGGRITRVEEYTDPAQGGAVRPTHVSRT